MMQALAVYLVIVLGKSPKVSLVVARGSKSGTLYMLHVSTIKNHVICVTEQLADWVICLKVE